MTYISTALELSTPASVLPVTLADFKLFMRIDESTDDTLLCAFLAAATDAAEQWTRRAFITQTYKYRFNSWPEDLILKLPRPPLASLTALRVLAGDGTVVSVLCAANYYVEKATAPGRVLLRTSVLTTVPVPEEYGDYLLEAEYEAGYGDDPEDVPQAIRQGIMFWAAAMNESRAVGAAPPEISRSILKRYRIPVF